MTIFLSFFYYSFYTHILSHCLMIIFKMICTTYKCKIWTRKYVFFLHSHIVVIVMSIQVPKSETRIDKGKVFNGTQVKHAHTLTFRIPHFSSLWLRVRYSNVKRYVNTLHDIRIWCVLAVSCRLGENYLKVESFYTLRYSMLYAHCTYEPF